MVRGLISKAYLTALSRTPPMTWSVSTARVTSRKPRRIRMILYPTQIRAGACLLNKDQRDLKVRKVIRVIRVCKVFRESRETKGRAALPAPQELRGQPDRKVLEALPAYRSSPIP